MVVTWGDVNPANPPSWIAHIDVYVGTSGYGSMNVTDGGTVDIYRGYIGDLPGSTGEVTVYGPNSKWTSNSFLVGYNSGSGTLNIIGGGLVDNSHGFIGAGSGSTGEVLVAGAGSIWETSWFSVGSSGNGTLKISYGGLINTSYDGIIGSKSDSTGVVTVDGSGSRWSNGDDLFVGKNGSGELNITDGGAVSNDNGYIGYNSSSTCLVTVDGSGSTWTNGNHLYVGIRGNGILNVTGGGAVSNGYSGTIGTKHGTTGTVTVDGTGSTWTSGLGIQIYSGSTLNITNGGEVINERDTWMYTDSSSAGKIHFDNGTLTTGGLSCSTADLVGTGTINTHGMVSDVDLVFDATHGLNYTFKINEHSGQDITINVNPNFSGVMGAGYSGVGKTSISEGVVVESDNGYIGYNSGSSGEVTVDGVGSMWTSDGYLYVGHEGNGSLNITNTGMVDIGGAGVIADKTGSMGEVTVDGCGSKWTLQTDVYVGQYGNGTLNITSGGEVDSYHGQIALSPDSVGQATVHGSDSMWANRGMLAIGFDGSGTLHVTAGGAVSNSRDGIIGDNSNSIGNVTVDGSGSMWTNNSDLYVGWDGSGTLNITDGGLVSVDETLTIDEDYDGDSFINMASGGMLALQGEADASLDEFLRLVWGTDAIRYWDDSVSDWADITGATYGDDYTLSYLVGGSLDGYTVLTVGVVPEPSTLVGLLGLCLAGLLTLARCKR